MNTSKIMMTVIVGCCVVSMTLAEPVTKPAQRRKHQMKPAVEKQTDAEQGSFSGRVVQMNDKRIVVRNWQEKMTFRPLRPKVKAPEDLTTGDFVKVEWSVAGKRKRIDKIEKMERPVRRRARPAARAEAAKQADVSKEVPAVREGAGRGKGKGKGKGEMMRDQAKKGQGEGRGEGKGKMKHGQAKKGQGKGANKGAGKGERRQKRDQSCEGCPKAGKVEK